MTSDGRGAEFERFRRIDAAFRAGDLAALRAAVEDPASIPNGPMPLAIGSCLEYAIYHSPLPFVRELLDLGANTNAEDPAGFPPLIAALSCTPHRGDAPARTLEEVVRLLELLLAFGADPNGRGIHDYTPLHMAVAQVNRRAVEILLDAGADPGLPTRIDDCETPRQMAERAGLREMAELLASREPRER